MDIVEHARRCVINYPTIVNNIPKDNNVYDNTPESFAAVDNKLAASQLDIGESSNLAQIAQTYECSFHTQKYSDYVCILSVIAQIAIDNAKRTFDINVSEEIRRIKLDMDIKQYEYPAFWKLIKPSFKGDINEELICPMNYLCDLKLDNFRSKTSTLPMDYFFQPFELEKNRKASKKVEELIEKYSLDLFDYNSGEDDNDNYLLLRSDFDMLISDIRSVYISKTYLGLFSWLLDRMFIVSSSMQRNRNTIKSKIYKNRSLLFKVLYEINPDNLIKCLSKNGTF